MIESGIFIYPEIERVVYGRPAAEAVAAEAERLGAERVFLLVSGTLNRTTDEIERVRKALGHRYAAEFDRMPAHTPRDAVVAAAGVARDAGADLIVTFGGGSVTDAGKVIQICLRHDIRDIDGLEPYRLVINEDGSRRTPNFDGPRVRQITVPTTLSGGEFSSHAGCTDPRTKMKQGYNHPLLVPRTVVLDPAPTVHTPEWLWLSTGIRALDHCVEGICSVRTNAFCDGAFLHALRLMSTAYPRVKADPGDLRARLDCQFAAWMSMIGAGAGVPKGASHAIGHVLGGSCDVPHGYTSCVMLPAVLRWNEPVNAERQKLVSEAMGRPGVPASEVVADFIAGLGLPRRLAEVGVGPDRFDLVAKNAMHDRWTHTNPRKITGPEQVREILEMAA